MDDLEVIRFLAMDIITNSDYHAFSCKKSPFLRGPLLLGVPTFNLQLDHTVSVP